MSHIVDANEYQLIEVTNIDTFEYIDNKLIIKGKEIKSKYVQPVDPRECKIDSAGNKRYYLDENNNKIKKLNSWSYIDETGKLIDLPASIYANGDKHWYKDGKHHRDNDLPAIIYADGGEHWYKDGKRNRDNDLPAIIDANGDQSWYKNGKYHRDNDLPAIIYVDGDKRWYKDGKYHRDNNLPAVINANGKNKYYRDGVEYFPTENDIKLSELEQKLSELKLLLATSKLADSK